MPGFVESSLYMQYIGGTWFGRYQLWKESIISGQRLPLTDYRLIGQIMGCSGYVRGDNFVLEGVLDEYGNAGHTQEKMVELSTGDLNGFTMDMMSAIESFVENNIGVTMADIGFFSYDKEKNGR